MMATLEKSWQSIAEMGQQMQQLADQQEWLSIAGLARLRHEAVTAHFQHYPVGPGNAEFYQTGLNRFFQQEARLKEIVENSRKNVLKDVSHISHNRRAINAYHDVVKPIRST